MVAISQGDLNYKVTREEVTAEGKEKRYRGKQPKIPTRRDDSKMEHTVPKISPKSSVRSQALSCKAAEPASGFVSGLAFTLQVAHVAVADVGHR